jgi:hypothetical protein
MKNPVIFYGIIALGVIALAVGMYYFAVANHPFHWARAYGGLGVGALLLIVGIVGVVMARPQLTRK